MPRPEKVRAVQDIKERMEEAQAFFLTEFRGLSVGDLQRLRRSLRESGADYRVVKMTLARRAADELGFEGVGDHLVGPTALTFAQTDAVATAKALDDYARENDKLVVKLGVMSGSVLFADDVSKLAKIEPREVLLAKIAGAAKAPLYQLAGLLSAFTRDTASMLAQLLEKKESGEFVPAGTAAAAAAPEAPAEAEAVDAGPAATEEAAEEQPAPAAEAEPETEAPAEAVAEDEPSAQAEPETPTDDTDDDAAAKAEEE